VNDMKTIKIGNMNSTVEEHKDMLDGTIQSVKWITTKKLFYTSLINLQFGFCRNSVVAKKYWVLCSFFMAISSVF